VDGDMARRDDFIRALAPSKAEADTRAAEVEATAGPPPTISHEQVRFQIQQALKGKLVAGDLQALLLSHDLGAHLGRIRGLASDLVMHQKFPGEEERPTTYPAPISRQVALECFAAVSAAS